MDLVNSLAVIVPAVALELLGTAANVLIIWGVILNNRRVRRCFLLWLAGNGLTCVVHLYAGMWSMLARDLLFLILAVHGYVAWGRPQPKENS